MHNDRPFFLSDLFPIFHLSILSVRLSLEGFVLHEEVEAKYTMYFFPSLTCALPY